ncbi:MAG: hypothetical protein ABI432_11605 [Flavobacteriales bacterium]
MKAGLRGLSAGEKVTLADAVHEALNANPHFPDPEPVLGVLLAARNELYDANVAALDRGRLACARKRSAIAAMDRVLARLAAYVNSKAQGDEVRLTTAGFPLFKRPTPVNDLQQPATLAFRPTQFPNKIRMTWPRVPGALVYQVEMAVGGDLESGNWERVLLTSKPQAIVDRTTAQQLNAFRVCAVGTQLQGPYSDVRMPTAA